MKLAILMYLQEDESCVDGLLRELQIEAFSRLPVEGHRPGVAGGWYGETAPYSSQLIMSVLPDDQAAKLTDAVARCTGVQDPRHPIRAVVLNVVDSARCENSKGANSNREETT